MGIVYAIIETGGKQYRVTQGDKLLIEMVDVEAGETFDVEKVLAVKKDGQLQVGAPFVEGASVRLKVEQHGKGKKIIVFKYKPKKNYRRKKGHRQPFTEVVVEEIKV